MLENAVVIKNTEAYSKVAATDMRYFAMNKFFRSLVHKENFGLTWHAVFKLGYLFCQ